LKHFHAIWRVAPGHENDWSRIYHLFYDITERKQAEKTLHESEEKFKNLADQSPNIIFIHSGGKIVYVNKKAEKMMGYTREEYYSPEFDFLCLIARSSTGK
jgi:PAS domain-containing protein